MKQQKEVRPKKKSRKEKPKKKKTKELWEVRVEMSWLKSAVEMHFFPPFSFLDADMPGRDIHALPN